MVLPCNLEPTLGIGLIKIPTARMAADGELRATISREDVADIYNISYQATPWLEATFRYSIFNPRNYSYSLDDLRDRSYEAKARSHVKELDAYGRWCSRYLGHRGLGGNYAVASKELAHLM